MIYKRENGYKNLDKKRMKEIFDFAEDYKKFLDKGKTEREVTMQMEAFAKKAGFKPAESYKKLKAGDKVYYINREKNIVLAVIGKQEIEEGANFIVAHIDSPRLDLKQNPLFEDSEYAMMKTHYYGGIKKYQWGSIPLAMHGVVILKNGDKLDLSIGEDEDEPIFMIPDLLPHLDKNVQRERKSEDVLKGEELKIIVGAIPATIKDKEVKDLVKYAIVEKLNKDYGIDEEDLFTAELELVPAHKAKDVGFDRALIAAYGHDDRVCSYSAAMAIMDLKEIPQKTLICYLADKEEIGSTGGTGLESRYLEFFMSDLITKLSSKDVYTTLTKCLWNSKSISSDVDAGFHPIFKEVHDEQNASKLSYGITLVKFTGARGKAGSNDADAEYISEIRTLFNKNNIKWQVSELGKVDEGGGGTVAKFLANYGIKTVDAGLAVLGMHSPNEVISKYDLYEIYKAYKVFLMGV